MIGGEAWVVAEGPGEARELATLARSLASTVVAFVVGSDAATEATGHGAAVVYVVDPGDALAGAALADAVEAVAAGRGVPAVLLFTMTADGRDAGGRLSTRWDRPVLTNAHVVVAADGTVVAGTEAGGGAVVVRTAFRGPPPWLVGVRPRAVEVTRPAVEAGSPDVRPAPPPPVRPGPRIVGRHVVARSGPRLEEARVIVTGGRGVGSAEGYALVEELAALLGGAAGATRAAIDAGWAPHVAKVGLTGASVAPDVYLAFGVSGASQHLVGMAASRHVVAVNTDRYAPMLALADLAVVGDATAILQRLVAALRARPAPPQAAPR